MDSTCEDDCIKILNEYQGKLTQVQYRNIEKVIGHLALKGMYLNQEAIERLATLSKKEITLEQAKAEILNHHRTSYTHGCYLRMRSVII